MLLMLLRAAIAAPVLALPLYAQSPSTSGTTIDLRYARFDPLVDVPAVPDELRAHESGRLWIVQFDRAPDDRLRASLDELGAERIGFLPKLAYVMRMDAAIANGVDAVDGVRWVGRYQPAYRLEPFLLDELSQVGEPPVRRYHLVVADKHQDKPALAAGIREIGGRVVDEQPGSLLFDVELTRAQLVRAAHLDQVLWIDRWFAPEEDMDNARIQGGGDYVETAGGFTGQGINGHIYEGVNAASPDFNSPLINVSSGGESSSHGHATAGIVFGNGFSDSRARGMAPSAQGFYTNYSSQVGSRWQVVQSLVTTHDVMFTTASWGTGRTTDYTSVSAEADDIVFDHDLPWTQSQSNAGNQDSRPQAWAKNVTSIGGVRHYNNSDRFDDSWGGGGSTGPAADGRIKPDLSAFYDSVLTSNWTGGTTNFSGTSSATPIVAGHNALAIQMFTDGLFGPVRTPGGTRFDNRPHAATLKALMIANARQYGFGASSSDNRREHVGWGFPDLRAMYDNRSRMLVVDETDALAQGQTQTYPIVVQPGDPELKVALTWSEPAANPAAATTLINDLSLRVTAPDGTIYWGNQGLDQANYNVPGGSADTRDSVECVFVHRPAPGNWTIEVIATLVADDARPTTPGFDVDFGLCATFGETGGRIAPYGSGCAGSTVLPGCETMNGNGGALTFASSNNEYAYDVTAGTNLTITGFELFTASRTGGNGSVQTAIYLDNGSGQPALTPVRTSTMAVTGATQFHATTISPPLSVAAGQRFWIAAVSNSAFPATLSAGTNSGAYYRSNPQSTSSWNRSSVIQRASYRVLCQGGVGTPLVPTYDVTGRPEPGRLLAGQLDKALANATAARLTGFSDNDWGGIGLPFDLGLLGAPGCTLLASGELVEPMFIGADGAAQLNLAIPPVAALIGASVYQQCAVLDAQANSFGFATTPAVAIDIGF